MTLTQINKAGLDELALDHVFTIGASGSSAYTFQGEGLNGTVNNPTLYLTRGKTYRFENGSGGHPIRIQSTSGASGTAYNTGVTNNAGSGTVIVEVQHDAPDVLYYQCTSHAAMNGILYITGALADGGVTTAKLADDAVTSAKLANTSVSAGSYGSATAIPAITVDAQGRITAASTNTVNTTTNLGTITETGAVTITSSTGLNASISEATSSGAGVMSTAHHDKLDGIAASANNYSHPNHSGDVTSSGDGATTIANNAVTTAKIADSAVTNAKLADNAVTNGKIAASTIITADIADSQITTAKIADQAITGVKIANGTITQYDLADSSVVGAKLANGSVVNAKIGDDAVTAAKIGAGACGTEQLGASAVTTAKIADDAITEPKLASGVGAMTKLYEVSTTGGTAVSSFSVDGYFDDSKYQHYQAVISDMYIASEGNQHTSPSMRFNVSGSAVTSQNYAWAFNESYGSGIHNRGSGTGTYDTSIAQMQGTWNVSGTTLELQNFNIFFYNPTTTGLGAKYVNWTSSWHQYVNANGTKYMGANVAMGVLVTNSALTGFTIFNPQGYNFTYKLSLYGIRK